MKGQTLPVDDFRIEQMRLQILLGSYNGFSFESMPIWFSRYEEVMKNSSDGYGIWSEINPLTKLYQDERFFHVGLYEPHIRLTSNSSLPYGENNEGAWYGRGFHSELFAGLWISSDYVTLTFRPQWVYHQNLPFEYPRFISYGENGDPLYQSEAIGEYIDAPFRFGSPAFTSWSTGYSSIRFHYKSLETGFGTDPMRWGSMPKYPLLLSNNAPGMPHFFLATRSPLRIPYAGKLSATLIGSFPENSDYFETNDTEIASRFMNGINLSFTPSIASNFTLGFARILQVYLENDRFQFSDLGIILDPFYLENFIRARGPLDQNRTRQQMNLIYFRWLWPENNFELFGEFYREDFAWDSRDLMMQPRHNSGYAFGFNKLFFAPLANVYKVAFELTNLTPSYLQEVRPQNYFYAHPVIRQGHTHRGQLLGAAIGPGSNSQSLDIISYQNWGRFGLFFRRLADNNHFHYQYDRSLNRPEIFRGGFGDYWRNRTDMTIGTRFLYKTQNSLLIQGEFSWTKLFNYGRYDYGRFGGLNISNFTPYDSTNLQFQLGFTYQF